jgi:hypothetical protein
MKGAHCGLLQKDRCPCMSHACYHKHMSPTYPQEDAIALSTLLCRAASVVAAKEGTAMVQAVSFAGLSPHRTGFDSGSVSVRFMARSTVTTPHSPRGTCYVGGSHIPGTLIDEWRRTLVVGHLSARASLCEGLHEGDFRRGLPY